MNIRHHSAPTNSTRLRKTKDFLARAPRVHVNDLTPYRDALNGSRVSVPRAAVAALVQVGDPMVGAAAAADEHEVVPVDRVDHRCSGSRIAKASLGRSLSAGDYLCSTVCHPTAEQQSASP